MNNSAYYRNQRIENLPEDEKVRMCLQYLAPESFGKLEADKIARKLMVSKETIRSKVRNWANSPVIIVKLIEAKDSLVLKNTYFYNINDKRSFHERFTETMESIKCLNG